MGKQEIVVKSDNDVSENRKHFKYRSSKCLNCGQPLDLSDVYCPYCSQLNTTKPLSLKDFLNEFLGSIISYDSRFRHTIKDLLFHPGRITKLYINGQRVRYANPFRFFLSVSIVYFLLNGLILSFSDDTENSIIEKKESNAAKTDINDVDDNNGVYFKNGDLKLTQAVDTTTKTFEKYYISEDSLSKLGNSQGAYSRFMMYNAFHQEHNDFTVIQALDSLKQEHTKYNVWLYNKTNRLDEFQKNPKDYAQYMVSKIPFFLFFLAPVYALFFWLLYYRQKRKYIEHLIFLFHIFTFLFLGLLIAKLPDLLLGENYLSGLLFIIIGPIYTYKAMRNYYQQSRWKTILKFVLLNFAFFIVTSFAMIAFIFGTAALY